MPDVINHVTRIDIRAEVHHQVAKRIDQVIAACREPCGSLVGEYAMQLSVFNDDQALVLVGEKQGIESVVAMQEDALDAIHIFAQHEP